MMTDTQADTTLHNVVMPPGFTQRSELTPGGWCWALDPAGNRIIVIPVSPTVPSADAEDA